MTEILPRSDAIVSILMKKAEGSGRDGTRPISEVCFSLVCLDVQSAREKNLPFCHHGQLSRMFSIFGFDGWS